MKIINIVGARPQFVKLAPILKAIEKHNAENPDNKITEVLVHTGQHYDYEMSQIFFDELGLKDPDYHLGVGSGTHAYQTGEILKRTEEVLLKEKPDLVMVYGDTNSTLAGALAAVKLHIPVAHVEAGLRSFNRKMPEEINRVLTDHISSLLFCPTKTAVENLRREGIEKGVHLVGDVMYDAVLLYLSLAEKKSNILERLNLEAKSYALATVHRAENTDESGQKSNILERLNLEAKSYALATVHRAENTDESGRLEGILKGLEGIAKNGLPVVFPVHPRTRKRIKEAGFSISGIMLIDAVSYLDMLILEKNARVILTDSGGVQKEAFFFKVPCVTLRDETEWVETVEAGWNTLAGCEPERIQVALSNSTFLKPVEDSNPFGNGNSAYKIVKVISDKTSWETF